MTARSIDDDRGWLGRTGAVRVQPSVILGLVTLAIHVAANGGYGFFRDELYFIVCGQRLAWGYVDQPPLIPLLARITRALLGDSLLALRVGPAVVMAVTVALTAEFARFLDGGRFAQAVFFGRNYGEAAAIDVFGKPLGLPPAISGHNNYYLWGPRGHDGNVVITLGSDPTELLKSFREATVAGRIDAPYAMPYETNLSIYVLRGIKAPLDWRTVKSYQ
jgi:hypothetical protein